MDSVTICLGRARETVSVGKNPGTREAEAGGYLELARQVP